MPGSTSAKARTIYEEGLRIPIMRIARAGVVDDDLLNLISLNSRLPEERVLDLRVQIATNEKGTELARELVRRMGMRTFERSIDEVVAYDAASADPQSAERRRWSLGTGPTGIAIERPVGTSARPPPGWITMSTDDRRSSPASPGFAYSGSASSGSRRTQSISGFCTA